MPSTVQDTSVSAQLRALARLQHIDSRIDQLEKLRGDLPEEIRDLDDEKAGLETRTQKFEEEAKQREVNKRQAELDIKDAEALIKKYEEQQLQVRNNREYDALTKEIEAQKNRITAAQNTITEIEESAEAHEAGRVEAQERLAELEGVLQAKRQELDDVMAETRQEQEQLEETRDDAKEAVDKRYLRAYDRLRGRVRDGRAVVPLVRGAAAGFAVPPQRQVEIRQRNRIVVCEHTGRIVIDEDLFNEVHDEVNA